MQLTDLEAEIAVFQQRHFLSEDVVSYMFENMAKVSWTDTCALQFAGRPRATRVIFKALHPFQLVDGAGAEPRNSYGTTAAGPGVDDPPSCRVTCRCWTGPRRHDWRALVANGTLWYSSRVSWPFGRRWYV